MKRKLDAAQVLSAFGAKPQQQPEAPTAEQKPKTKPTAEQKQEQQPLATMATLSTVATVDELATLATESGTTQQYRHIAINNDIWGKVKALQAQTGAPLNHIINRALHLYIQEIEKANGSEISTTKIKLL